MELARFQAAVARLSVDTALRERFYRAPAEAAAELGLSPEEGEQLRRQVEGLEPFADSLVRKRLGAVRQLLPRTAQRLGGRFDDAFRQFAAAHPSRGPHRHEHDALELASVLKPELAGEDLEALLIEAGWIEMMCGRKLLIRRLPRGVAMWLRTGRQVRFWKIGGAKDWTSTAPAAQESEQSFR